VTVATIHQRLVDEYGLDASVASVRRWVRANLPEQARRAQVTVLRDCPPAGSQAQIDYGRLGMWLDPATGRRRTVWAFVMVLPCSRHMFVRPTLSMDQREWTAAHVEAFAFFGGYVGVGPTIEAPGGPRWRRSSTWSANAVDAVLASSSGPG
jgi:transposase